MAASPRWYPVCGLVIGVLACLPSALGLFHGHATLQAVCYLLIMFWATRGLHWDGLSDCLDAWGSGARGEKFQTILKDSRIGAFGVMGIVFVFATQLVCLTELLRTPSPHTWALLVLAPALGRASMLVLPALLPPHPVSTLGRLVAPGCTPPLAVGWAVTLLAALVFCQNWKTAAVCLFFFLAFLYSLIRLARREGGFNGDFLGSACLLGETCVLLAALI